MVLMKNLLRLFVVVLAAGLLLVSCNLEKGGTIEVTNGMSMPTYVDIIKGVDIINAIKEGDGTLIQPGKTKIFTFNEDGTYTVTAIPPPGFIKPVILLAGDTQKVTVK